MVALSSSLSAVQYLLAPASLPKTLLPVPPPTTPTTTSESSTSAQLNESSSSASLLLSVLSYNVLLPNSVDGWWNYKMYLPPLTDRSMAEWPYRRNLLQERIKLIDADVVCLQEVAPRSFEDDFEFMKDLGYDEHEMFKKGRFRPATFWKSNRVQLAVPPVHKDRTLLTAFRPVHDTNNRNVDNVEEAVQEQPQQRAKKKAKDKNPSEQQQEQQQRYWYVLNCHLQAGAQAQRRVRQINEGVRAVLTAARKLKEKNPEESVRLIVCGDMNGGSECGAVRYLEDGAVDETFFEDGKPVTSSKKVMPLAQPLVDVAVVGRQSPGSDAAPDGEDVAAKVVVSKDAPPPPTLVVPELISLLIKDGTAYTPNPELSLDVVERLGRIYKRFATSSSSSSSSSSDGTTLVMNREDTEKWLVEINEKLGRGSEFRQAAREMGWTCPDPDMSLEKQKDLIRALPEDGVLTLEGFINVYHEELKQGKFWGIAHDLAVLGEALPTGDEDGGAGIFTARFDRMYCNGSACYPLAVLDTVCTTPCPNVNEPSDHLPIAATFVAR